jgi:hypothetical protein
VQVGTNEGRSEGWSEGITDEVGAWELVGAKLGALEVEGADELVGADDCFLPFLLCPPFPPLPFPLVGTADGILEGVSEGRSDAIDETEGAAETPFPPFPPFPPLPLNVRPDKAPKTLEKRSESKMMVVPVVVFMMKKGDVEK